MSVWPVYVLRKVTSCSAFLVERRSLCGLRTIRTLGGVSGAFDMPTHMTTAEVGFCYGCRAADPEITLAAIAGKLFAWRKAKRKSRTGRVVGVECPSDAAVSRALAGETHVEAHKELPKKRAQKRGRPSTMPAVLASKIPRLLEGLETKNRFCNVTCTMLTEELKEKADLLGLQRPTAHVVYKTLAKQQRAFRPNVHKLRLNAEKAQARLEFAQLWVQRPLSFWRRRVLCIDEGTCPYFTSREGRKTGRSMKKTHSFRTKTMEESHHPSRVTQKRGKHRPGIKSARVFVGVGQGRVQFWEYYDHWGAAQYGTYLCDYAVPAIEYMKSSVTGPIYMMRDGDPKSHETYLGRQVEADLGLHILKQPTSTPEVNVEDNSIWTAVEREMEAYIRTWEHENPGEDFSETYDAFKARARATALSLPAEAVDSAMEHTKTVMHRLIAAEGWYIRG